MSSPEGTFLQLNLKVGNILLNAYAGNAEEFDEAIDILRDRLEELAKLDAEAVAVANVAHGLNSSTPPAQAPRNQYADSNAQEQAAGPAPSCEHGSKTFVSGTSRKDGSPWKAWDCPANVCKRDFINDNSRSGGSRGRGRR